MVIGERRCEPPITAAGFSSCPEGVSVNVVATGHRNGMVRLWSSWDLSPVRDIPTLQTSAVTAVAFSFDNQVCSSNKNHPETRLSYVLHVSHRICTLPPRMERW